VTATPRIVSLWPARYFVAEWKTMSAPRSSGRCRIGEAKVLSTTTSGRGPSPNRSLTTFTVAAISTTFRSGLVGDSNHTRRVRSVSASQSDSGSPARLAYFVATPFGPRTLSR